jgi:DNA-binding transcriptional regulator YiaG
MTAHDARTTPTKIAHDAPDYHAYPATGYGVRQWREARGISQAQLGKLLEIPANTIAKWERGEQTIRHPRILLLAMRELSRTLPD